jgi:hypothetical protein
MLFLIFAVLVSGCSSLPGLRVLTGQQDTTSAVNSAQVSSEQLDLVMADKTASTDPAFISAADRIEAASGNVDVIEIRQDEDIDLFYVDMLFVPPQGDGSPQAQAAQNEALRRAIEYTWQAVVPLSEGSDLLRVRLLGPQPIDTLDSGESYLGIVIARFDIERNQAMDYLRGSRSMSTFTDLIIDGKLTYDSPQQTEWYQGQPNHPMFMLSLFNQQAGQ